MLKKSLLLAAVALSTAMFTSCGSDKPISYVPEEQGLTFEKITDETVDNIVTPRVYINYEYGNVQSWAQYHAIDISNDGKSLAYVASNNHNWNIFVRNTESRGSSMQRTHRENVTSFCYSPNGENICFSEYSENGHYQLYITNAKQGSFIQQISPSNVSDFAPRYSTDGKKIFFERWDGQNYTIWSYDLAKG